MEEQDLKFCENCKKEVSGVNFLMHTAHCHRNIALCKMCEEPFPKNEIDAHITLAHSKIKCAKCNEEIERQNVEKHDVEICAKRLVRCGFCDIEVQASEQSDHEDYCGSRTERCDECGQYVMLKYCDIHNSSNHIFLTIEDLDKQQVKQSAVSSASLYSGLKNFNTDKDDKEPLSIRSHFNPGKRTNDMPQINVNANVGQLKETNKPILQELCDTQTLSAPADSSSMSMEQLDRLLAMHLAEDDMLSPYANSDPEDAIITPHNVGSPFMSTEDFEDLSSLREENECFSFSSRWANRPGMGVPLEHSDAIVPISRLIKPPDDAASMSLPCEFCNELFLADQLLDHQSFCEFSSMRNNPTRRDSASMADHLFSPELNNSKNMENCRKETAAIHNNLVKATNVLPKLTPDDDEVMIPCEYCGTLFDANYIIEHQSGCGFLEEAPAPPPQPAVISKDAPVVPNPPQQEPRIEPDSDIDYLDDLFLKEAIENSLKDKSAPVKTSLESTRPLPLLPLPARLPKVRQVPIQVDPDYSPRKGKQAADEADALSRIREAKAQHVNRAAPVATTRRFEAAPDDRLFNAYLNNVGVPQSAVDLTGARPKSFARKAEADSTTGEPGNRVSFAAEHVGDVPRSNAKHFAPPPSQGAPTSVPTAPRVQPGTRGAHPSPRPPPRQVKSKQPQY